MDLLEKNIHYATYVYYSSSFLREHFSKLFKSSFYLNFPLFYIAGWLFLEGLLENYITEESTLEAAGNVMGFLSLAGAFLALFLIPKNHLKLYKDIFHWQNQHRKLSGSQPPILNRLNLNAVHDIMTQVKYWFAQLICTSASLYLFLIVILMSVFIFGIVFSIFAVVAAATSNVSFIVLAFISVFLIYMVLYSASFGLPCFLPAVLTFHHSWENRRFFARTLRLGFRYLRYVTLLFSLEVLVKMVSTFVFVMLLSNIEHFSWNLQDENVFETLPNLVKTSLWEQKTQMVLTFAFWGFFGVIWDIFKACFISYLFAYDAANVSPRAETPSSLDQNRTEPAPGASPQKR